MCYKSTLHSSLPILSRPETCTSSVALCSVETLRLPTKVASRMASTTSVACLLLLAMVRVLETVAGLAAPIMLPYGGAMTLVQT
jgi:hypothetical protein